MQSFASLFLIVAAGLAATVPEAADVDDFDWSSVVPSTALNYTSCYNGHKCGKLTLPLDWLDKEGDSLVTLAIITRPAAVSQDDPSFGGTIIVNPGGPSGSGVDFMLRLGETVQKQADSGKKRYEILSFDPRGVGLSEPRADCYYNEFARGQASVEERVMGDLNSEPSTINHKLAASEGYGRLCESFNERNGEIFRFMSTSSVARDMVEIVDKLQELRTGIAAKHSFQEEVATDTQIPEQPRLELRDALEPDTTPRILYWGFSYGTILGRYFVSMFPGRVGRVILEAVADTPDYSRGEWALNLPDTQQCLQHFWDTCFSAKRRCELYKASDRQPADIEKRVRDFMEQLDVTPTPYIHEQDIVMFGRQDVLHAMFRPLYSPQRRFPALAATIFEAMNGNFTALYQTLSRPEPVLSCSRSNNSEYIYTWNQDAQSAIACGDGDSQIELGTTRLAEHVERLQQDSPDFGGSWASLRARCSGWKIRPSYNFKGPFTTPEVDHRMVKGRPAAGVLFASSQSDPVTPLASARRASADHPGSQLLIQNNVGHGSIDSPGKCRENFIAKYLDTGRLPAEEVVCEPDCVPFEECPQLDRLNVAGLAGHSTKAAAKYRAPLQV